MYEGDKLIDGAVETLDLLLKNFRIKYLTNAATKPRKLIFEKLLQFKLPVIESDIFSPPVEANIFLKKKIFQKFFC